MAYSQEEREKMMWTIFFKESSRIHANILPKMGQKNFYDNVNRDEFIDSIFDMTRRMMKKWKDLKQ